MQDNFYEEMEELSPTLRNLKEKGTGFTVPADYFEGLTDELLQTLHAPPAASAPADHKSKNRPGLDWLRQMSSYLFQPQFALGLACGAALIAVAVYLFSPVAQAPEAPFAEGSLTEDEIAEYISVNIDDFDTDLIIKFLGDGVEDAFSPIRDMQDQELEEAVDGFLDDLDIQELKELL